MAQLVGTFIIKAQYISENSRTGNGTLTFVDMDVNGAGVFDATYLNGALSPEVLAAGKVPRRIVLDGFEVRRNDKGRYCVFQSIHDMPEPKSKA